ncbi:MAG TPA: PP2C family protein-serine/threonine phosphatase [Polyangia bacterium]|nr:PP2C family protein-serine/threonine phosphatase [Polyangia bacterium]
MLYLPTWSRLRIATKQRTQAGRGGDFFEVFQHREGPVTTVMADVAGNGPRAAVPVSDLRWAFRQRLARGEAPGEVLAAVNDWLIGQSVHELLVTALCIRVDVQTGLAEIASAGHLGPFVKRWTGAAEAVTPAPALPLGILTGETYSQISTVLSLQDALVLATDGITDRLATADDPLGEKGLLEQLGAVPPSGRHICEALLALGAGTEQDATVVVVQMPASARRRRRGGSPLLRG